MLDRQPINGNPFKLVSDFVPKGDQISAIDTLAERFQAGDELQDLVLAAPPRARGVDVDGGDHGRAEG